MLIISKIVSTLGSKLTGPTTFRRRIIWFLLSLFSLGGMIDIPGSALLPVSTVSAYMVILLIAMFKGAVLAMMLDFSRSVKWLHVTIKIFIILYCLLCVINASGYELFDMGITIKMITVLGQTNSSEVQEFLPTLFYGILRLFNNPYTYLLILVIAGCIGILKIIPQRCYRLLVGVSAISGMLCLISVFFLLPNGRTNFLIILRVVKSSVYAHKEMSHIKEEMTKITPLPNPDSVNSSRRADIVIVVGESANRSNMSLYGYELTTTPELDRIKDKLIIFTDVIGSSTITSYNMNRILTFLSDNEPADEWYKRPMLFSLMKQAGYRTAWLSNQEISGLWGNSTAAMVSMADDVRFVGGTSSDDATLQKNDSLLLPALSDVLKSGDKAKFIGLHLMGSHTEYRRRYPAKFARFTTDSVKNTMSGSNLTASRARTRAEYDNSIRFTDWLLGRIVNEISNSSRPTLLIYFSDHGENVYDEGGDYRGRDEKHVEVPFIIYPNHAFAESYPETIVQLNEVRNKPMSTASLSHLVCTLTGTEYHSYDSTYDITSPDYQMRPRFVDDHIWRYEHVHGK